MMNYLKSITSILGLLILANVSVCAGTGNALLLKSNLPGNDPDLADKLSISITQAGYAVKEISAADICIQDILDAKKYDLLVLPNSANLPAASTETIDKYLQGGGDIIALNAPMWQRSLININGNWMEKEEYQKLTASMKPENAIFTFNETNIKDWKRGSSNIENPAICEISTDSPIADMKSMHVVVSDHQGWDTLGSIALNDPFPSDNTLTIVTAKGDARTKQIYFEWVEKDNSRWMATIDLSEEWRRYILRPEDFKYWTSNPKRGEKGDKFNPANAMNMAVGVAFSHTGFTTGRHEYWVGSIGTAKMTSDIQELMVITNPPALDILSPGYKFFKSNEVSNLTVRNDQTIIGETKLSVPAEIGSSSPRPKAGGFNKNRTWRWIPLIDAKSATDEWRGVPAAMIIHTDGNYKGGAWASFGIKDSGWYKSEQAQGMIKDIANRMKNDVYLLDAGSDFYTYFKDQKMKLGIRTSNIGTATKSGLKGKIKAVNNETGKIEKEKVWNLSIKGKSTKTVSLTWKPSAWPKNGYTITTELYDGDQLIDIASHDAFVWLPKQQKSFITNQNGNFMLNGKRWRANGVNYMPSSGIAIEDGDYFEHWIGSRAYDPEVIERDIQHMADMGLNSVSIFIYHQSMKAQNLLDILRRLENHGLKANLSMRPGTPMDFLWAQMKEIIEYYRLKDNDTVFAYDLAWEPWHGTHEARKTWDSEWESWVIERYGSISNAEQDWNYKIPRDESGKVTNPMAIHMTTPESPKMAAAYRRFLDTLLYKKYNAARTLVKSIDPNHMVSFRMSEAGNPTFIWGEAIPYDFPYLATAVDILEPEGYGRIGKWDNVKPGIFAYEYARWAAPAKPMMWAEAGYSAWDISSMRSSESNLEFQGDYLNDFYKMLNMSGADGVFFWWYPGGFRYGENSDYGIINPDGTDRPSTKTIRKNSRDYINGPDAKPNDMMLEMDRDEHPIGIGGVYQSMADEYRAARDQGKTPGLHTKGTGTFSSNCPLIAVGNSIYNGSNPMKYLDGAIDKAEIKDAKGRWKTIEKGGSIRLKVNKPVEYRIYLTNVGEAAWIASKSADTGSVWLTVNGKTADPISANVPYQGSTYITGKTLIPDTFDEDSMDLVFSLESIKRAKFGEKFNITVNIE